MTGTGTAILWLAGAMTAATAATILTQPDAPDSPEPAQDLLQNLETPEDEAELDAVQIGNDTEAKKKASAKARFKVERKALLERGELPEDKKTGLKTPEGDTGVQL